MTDGTNITRPLIMTFTMQLGFMMMSAIIAAGQCLAVTVTGDRVNGAAEHAR